MTDKYEHLKNFVKLLATDLELVVPSMVLARYGYGQPSPGSSHKTPEERLIEQIKEQQERLAVEEAMLRLLKNAKIANTFIECDDLLMATLKENK